MSFPAPALVWIAVVVVVVAAALALTATHPALGFEVMRQEQFTQAGCTGNKTADIAYVLPGPGGEAASCVRTSPTSSYVGSCASGQRLSVVLGFSSSAQCAGNAGVLRTGCADQGSGVFTRYSCSSTASYALTRVYENVTDCTGPASVEFLAPLDGACVYGLSYRVASNGTSVVASLFSDGACLSPVVNSSYVTYHVGVCVNFFDASKGFVSSRTATIFTDAATPTPTPTPGGNGTRCGSSASTPAIATFLTLVLGIVSILAA